MGGDMSLKSKGEFGLIEEIRKDFPAVEGILGIGDDCAVIPQQIGMETLVSTDMLVEGTHFLLEEVHPYELGWKSAAVNFSDIAAMGGSPLGCFLSFALPSSLPEGWTEQFLHGFRDICNEYAFPLLGGDTCSSPDKLSISVTVLGQSPVGGSMKRSGAKAGDLICVTGTLGDSGCGLKVILDKLPRTEDAEYLVRRHYHTLPRVAEGQALAAAPGVHSMMDISDGLASDIRHIMEESHCGAKIDVARLPISAQMMCFCAQNCLDPVRTALCGGEDYELLFTVTEEQEIALGVPHTVVGRITEGSALEWISAEGEFMGYRHF